MKQVCGSHHCFRREGLNKGRLNFVPPTRRLKAHKNMADDRFLVLDSVNRPIRDMDRIGARAFSSPLNAIPSSSRIKLALASEAINRILVIYLFKPEKTLIVAIRCACMKKDKWKTFGRCVRCSHGKKATT